MQLPPIIENSIHDLISTKTINTSKLSKTQLHHKSQNRPKKIRKNYLKNLVIAEDTPTINIYGLFTIYQLVTSSVCRDTLSATSSLLPKQFVTKIALAFMNLSKMLCYLNVYVSCLLFFFEKNLESILWNYAIWKNLKSAYWKKFELIWLSFINVYLLSAKRAS